MLPRSSSSASSPKQNSPSWIEEITTSAGCAWLVPSIVSQKVDERLAGSGYARADRADRDVAGRGCLRVGQAKELGEHERFPAVVIELLEETMKLDVTGMVRFVGSASGRELSAALTTPDLVGRDVACDREEPCSCAGVAPEPRDRAQRPQIDLLRQVIGSTRIDKMRAEPPHVRLGVADEPGEGFVIARSGREQELGGLIHPGPG